MLVKWIRIGGELLSLMRWQYDVFVVCCACSQEAPPTSNPLSSSDSL
jgi:hypothetical protein